MHTCNKLLPDSAGGCSQCRKPAVRSVLLTWYGDGGYYEMLFWLCEEHYNDQSLVKAWEDDGWEYAY